MALYQYTLTTESSSNTYDEILIVEGGDNFIVSIFKAIMRTIQNVIDSFNILINKKIKQEEINTPDYKDSRIRAMESKIYNSAKTTIDKGLFLIDKLMDGSHVEDETVDGYIQETRDKINGMIKKRKSENSLEGNLMRSFGYKRMRDLLVDSQTRIKEDSRKLYNKNTEMEKKNQHQISSITREITGFISALGKL